MSQESLVETEADTTGNYLELLDEDKVEYVILDQTHDAELLKILQRHPAWMMDCEAEEAVIFSRNSSGVAV